MVMKLFGKKKNRYFQKMALKLYSFEAIWSKALNYIVNRLEVV